MQLMTLKKWQSIGLIMIGIALLFAGTAHAQSNTPAPAPSDTPVRSQMAAPTPEAIASEAAQSVATTIEVPKVAEPAKPETPEATRAFLADLDAHAKLADEALKKKPPQYDAAYIGKLSEIRGLLASDRDRAREVADQGSLDSRVLQAEIASLGPPPADGTSELQARADLRAELNAKTSELMAPILRAGAATARASTLVAELDGTIAVMKSEQTFERSYAMIDPRLWIGAAGGLAEEVGTIGSGAKTAAGGEQTSFWGRIIAGIALLIIGPGLSSWLLSRIIRVFNRRLKATESLAGKLILHLIDDALKAVVAIGGIGMAALAILIILSSFASIETAVKWGVVVFLALGVLVVARWLGESVLHSPFPDLRLLKLPHTAVAKAISTINYIGILLGLELMIAFFETQSPLRSELAQLLSGLVVLVGGWLGWRLANIIADSRKAERAEQAVEVAPDGTPETRIDFAGPLARLLKLFVAASIAAALVGYMMLAREIFGDVLLSLATIAVAVYFHRTVRMVLGLLAAGRLYPYRKIINLLPLATGFIILIASLVLIAIVWGYNVDQIMDAVTALRTGVSFGEVKISAGDVFTFAGVFFLGYLATSWARRILKITILPQFGLDIGAQAALLTGFGYIGVVLSAVVAIATTGIDLSNLAFIAGALSVGLGFGLQSTIENFTSGVILLVERPIKEGDWIEVGDYSGIVRKIAVRSTHIETFDRHQIIIPNSQLITGSVKNLSFSSNAARILVPVGVAYGTDHELVRAVLLDIAEAHELVLDTPPPAVSHGGFGDSAITFKLFAFVADVTRGAGVISDLNFAIAARFAKEGIEMPFPQRDLHIRSGIESLLGNNPAPAEG